MRSQAVQQIKERLSIVDVVTPYVKLTRAGATFKARCPFHSEKTPSFTVSPERGTYHCFGCGVGGDIFTFTQEIEGVDFKTALTQLADKAGVPLTHERSSESSDDSERLYRALEEATLFFQKKLPQGSGAHSYLISRGVTDETIEKFRVGFAEDGWRNLHAHLRGKNYTDTELLNAGLIKKGDKGVYDAFRSRIMFPIADASGRVVGFSGRIFAAHGASPPDVAKYLNTGETALYKKSKLLYGFDKAKQVIRKLDFSILVEGQMDLVMVHQAGWGNAVAVSGTALTGDHVLLLRRMSENVLLALDADEAGLKAAEKSAMLALSVGLEVKAAVVPSGKDPADLIALEGKEAWNAVVRSAKPIITFLLSVLQAKYPDERAFKKSVEERVLPFVRLVQSPIDKDHFIQEVARALDTPLEVIREALGKAVSIESGSMLLKDTPSLKVGDAPLIARLKDLWGFLEWQRTALSSGFDLLVCELRFKRAVGQYSALFETLPENEKRSLVFKNERAFSQEKQLQRVFLETCELVERERLKEEYRVAQEKLREAEKSKDQEAVTKALELCTGLLKALADVGS